MEAIAREGYLEKIEKFLGKETIVVLVGQRRVGKSYVLRLLRERKEQEAGNHVIYIDKEKRQFDFIQTYQDLNAYIEEHLVSLSVPSGVIGRNRMWISSSQVPMPGC